MQPLVHFLLASLLSSACCFFLISKLSVVASKLGLVDRPSVRKVHSGHVPLVGGIAIFCTVLLVGILLERSTSFFLPLLVGSILVVIGAFDDRFELSAGVRLPFQIGAAVAMIYFGGIGIESIGNIAGTGPILFTGLISVCFTVGCTVGVVNSINMIDGVDGLSGTLVFLTLVPLTYLNWSIGDYGAVTLLVCLQSALLSFLYFNARVFREKAAVFLGDAGSMLFGLVVVWFLIALSQGDNAALSPIAAGWIFGLPLVDTVSVMVRRIVERRSPFDADRNHLHHKFIDFGFSINQTVFLMALLHSAFILIGLIGNTNHAYEPFLFWLFTVIVIVHYLSVNFIISTLSRFRASD